ncbi:MAG: two-component regulator propeller domain-containing protein [Bacteroidota bacterium]
MLVSSIGAKAQQPGAKRYTAEDGLAGDVVYSAFQDRDNFIWFATETGVSRFDGSVFTNYGIQNGLADNEIMKIFQDSEGRIWFLSLNGQLSYRHNGVFYNPENDSLAARARSKSMFLNVMEDGSHNLWFTTYVSGLMKIDPAGKVTWPLMFNTSPGNHAVEVYVDAKGATRAICMDGMDQVIERGPDREAEDFYNFRNLICERMCVTKNGNFYGTKGAEVMHFEPDSIPEYLVTEEMGLLDGKVSSLIEIENDLWACSKKGALRISGGLSYNEKFKLFLKGRDVSSVMRDAENNYWFTTLGDGVFMMASPETVTYTNDDGLPDNHLNVLRASPEGDLWYGAPGMHFGKIKGNKIIDLSVNSERKHGIRDFAFGDGLVYMGTEGGVVVLKGDKPVNYLPVNTKALLLDKKGGVFIGSSGALYYLNESNINKFKKVFESLNATFSDFKNELFNIEMRKMMLKTVCAARTEALLTATDGSIWAGTSNGLYKCTPDSSESWARYGKILGRRIVSLACDKRGNIFAGTYGYGLICINRRGKIKNFNVNHGLTSNLIKNLYFDDEDNLWVGTNIGLNKLSQKDTNWNDITVSVFTVSNGLASDFINSVSKTGDTLWIGTIKGLTALSNDYERFFLPPYCHITDCKVDGKSVLYTSDSLIFPSKSGLNINISFVGLRFRTNNNVEYRYRLKATEPWIVSTQPNVQFPGLPGDYYRFEVQCRDKGGHWGTSTYLEFTIEKPWYEHRWFKLTSAFSIISILTGIALGYTAILKQRERRRAGIQLRIAGAEQTALRSQMNPHFIFNSLNSIQRFIIRKDTRAAYDYLEKFGRLIRNILENSRSEYISLEEEIQMLELYIDLESLRFDRRFFHRIEQDSEMPGGLRIPSMLIQPFVENAIWHGFMPEKENRPLLLTLTFSLNDGVLHCIIEDNGVGRVRSAALREQQAALKKSLGLIITMERVNIYNHEKERKITIDIKDLYHENGDAAGTRVELCFPV